MRDHVGDPEQLRLGRARLVDKQQDLPVGNAAEVFHRAPREVGHRHHVEFLARIRDAVVVREELQGERSSFERVAGQVPLANRVNDPERHAADIHGVGRLERTHDERHQVRRHDHRVLEHHPLSSVAEIGFRDRRTVRDHELTRWNNKCHTERRLERWLVETRERPPGVGALELRGGDRVLYAIVVSKRRTIETAELIVQDSCELGPDRVRTRR